MATRDHTYIFSVKGTLNKDLLLYFIKPLEDRLLPVGSLIIK